MSEYVLYDFPRSSASYRVRIALELKGIAYRCVSIDLRAGDQRSEDYLAVSKSGLVPSLQLPDGTVLSQSLAIIRYLDTVAEPRLFPSDPHQDANVSALALAIASDIHPLNNLRVLNYLQIELGLSDAAKSAWYSHWVLAGLRPIEAQVALSSGIYCFGDELTAVDVCLVPQMANARRFEVDLTDLPGLCAIERRLNLLKPIQAAAPEN